MLSDSQAEIRLRAIAQIGKLSRELEKAQGSRTELPSTDAKKLTKAQQLDAAGLKARTANRYEELAAPSAQALNSPRGNGSLFAFLFISTRLVPEILAVCAKMTLKLSLI
jgi:hypothetical protein